MNIPKYYKFRFTYLWNNRKCTAETGYYADDFKMALYKLNTEYVICDWESID